MGLEDVVVHHWDVLPAGHVPRQHLLHVAELAENGVGLVLQGEKLHTVIVEPGFGQFGVDPCFDDSDNLFGHAMAETFSCRHRKSSFKRWNFHAEWKHGNTG